MPTLATLILASKKFQTGKLAIFILGTLVSHHYNIYKPTHVYSTSLPRGQTQSSLT